MLTEISIQGCKHVFDSWSQVMKDKRLCKTDQQKVAYAEDMMNMGLRLSTLTKKANQSMSPFLLNDMFIFLVSLVTWSYMACVILFPRNMELLKINWIPLWNALIYLFLAIENAFVFVEYNWFHSCLVFTN